MRRNAIKNIIRASGSALGLMLVTACLVQVGNPTGKAGTGSTQTGTSSILLASSPLSQMQHVYFNLTGLSAVDLNSVSHPLSLTTSGQVDLLTLSGLNGLTLSPSASLPVGTYGGLALELDRVHPMQLVASDGTMQYPQLGNGLDNEIFLPQVFNISSAPLSLVVAFALQPSFQQASGTSPYTFTPQASVLPAAAEASLTGQVNDTSYSQVCAYLKLGTDFIPGSPYPQAYGGGDAASKALAPPPQSVQARLPPTITTPTYDTTASCSEAATTATVSGGSFTLSNLWPGTYFLRFFRNDQSHADASGQGISVAPAQTTTLSAAQAVLVPGVDPADDSNDTAPMGSAGYVLKITGGALKQAVNACGVFTVSVDSSAQQPSSYSLPVTGNLTTSTTTGAFYSDSGCQTVATTFTLTAVAPSATVYYKDTAAGTATLNAAVGAVSNQLFGSNADEAVVTITGP